MKKRLSILLICIVILSLSKDRQCLAQNFSPEQQHQIASLNTIITNPNSPDTSLAGAYVALSEILYVSNIDTLKSLCETAKKIAEKGLQSNPSKPIKHSLLKSLASSYNNIGYVYGEKGNISKQIQYYQKSLEISKKIGDKETVATSLNNMGYIYQFQGDIPKAIEYYHRSLKIREEIGNKKHIAYSFINIGAIHERQDEKSKAIEYYTKALKIQEEIGDKWGLASSLDNIGNVYSTQGDITRAIDSYNKGLNIREEIDDLTGIATSLSNIGYVYQYHGNITKALEYYYRALKIREKLGYKIGIANSLKNIGSIEFKLGNLLTAQNFASRSLDIAKELGFPSEIRNAAELLSQIHEKKGEGMLALDMYKLYLIMKDSINNEETQKVSIKQEVKFEYEKQKVLDDAENDKLIAIEKEAKEKQQVITYATGAGLGLVGIFLFFVFNRLQVTRKQKKVIEVQKQEVEQQKSVVEQAHDLLEEKNKEILDSITYAKRIQSAILPSLKVVKEYLQESFILYKPKDIVAGDFYWLEHKDGKVLFAAADCTGHGVPGAMVSVVCNNALNRSVREYGLIDPGQILDKTRKIVIAEFEKSEDEVKDGMDIALCSIEGNTLKYAGANNPLWIIRNGVSEIEEVKADKQPIGKYAEPTPYTTHTIELQKGDSIYIFSDGFADQFGGEKGKKFKAANFKQLLLSIQNETIEKQKQLIDETFEKWKGELEQLDDVCVIGVRI